MNGEAGVGIRPSRSGYFAHEGLRLYFEGAQLGPGSALMIDGIGCDGYAWRYLKPALAQSRGYLHAQLRGHGRSEEGPCDLRRLARDFDALCTHLGLTRPTVIAHSMGVQVALELARLREVQAQVLISGTSGRLLDAFHGGWLAKELPTLIQLANTHPRLARLAWRSFPGRAALALAKRLGEVNPGALIPDDFLAYWQGVGRVDARFFLQMLREAQAHDAAPYLAEIDVPTLVISGGQDTFISPDISMALAGNLPQASLKIYAEATHALPAEAPKALRDDTLAFLEAHSRCS